MNNNYSGYNDPSYWLGIEKNPPTLEGRLDKGVLLDTQTTYSGRDIKEGERLFEIKEENAEAWIEALAKHGIAASIEAVRITTTYYGYDSYESDYNRVKKVVRTALSGQQFHKIGLLEGVIAPETSRDQKILAKK